jgi:flagellar hook-basal body complex protein FliE
MAFVSAVGVVPPIAPTPVVQPISSTPTVAGTGAASGGGFENALSSAVDNLGAAQSKADGLAVQAATGTLQNPVDYMIAANEASLTTQMTVAVRNKALDAFNEIMRMPL